MTASTPSFEKLTVFGASWCRDCIRAKAFLDDEHIEYDYIDLVATPELADTAKAISGRTNIPVIAFPDGSFLVEPSNQTLQAALEKANLLP